MASWEVIEGRLVRELVFGSFREALLFVNQVGMLAEQLNHHPDILIHSYKKVRLTLYTHFEKKISDKDYALAQAIDHLAGSPSQDKI